MKEFLVYFLIDGIEYHFNAKDINRNMADGCGNKILYVKCYNVFGKYCGVANLTTNWEICSFCKN